LATIGNKASPQELAAPFDVVPAFDGPAICLPDFALSGKDLL
jgi:hypothetical protein